MTESSHSELLLFDVGGRSFAVEVASIYRIAGASWQPEPEDAESGQKAGICISLASYLNLPVGEPSRTLIVDARGMICGFQIDRIGGEYLGNLRVDGLPRLLHDWLEPAVVAGFAVLEENQQLVNVLDLHTMTRLLHERAELEAKVSGS